MNAQLEINENDGSGCFYHVVKGQRQAVMDILITDTQRLVIKHTEVAQELAGQGYGKSLVKTAADYARQHGYRILSVCPYAKNILYRNREEYDDILV